MKKNLLALALAAANVGRGGIDLKMPKGPTPNKYTPHQGAQEKARRVRQRERNAR